MQLPVQPLPLRLLPAGDGQVGGEARNLADTSENFALFALQRSTELGVVKQQRLDSMSETLWRSTS